MTNEAKAEQQPVKVADERNRGALSMVRQPGKSDEQIVTETVLSPITRSAVIANTFAASSFEGSKPSLDHTSGILAKGCAAVRGGDLDHVTDMLTAQMSALDALFTHMVGRASSNFGQHPSAVDRYMGIAFKAQSSCRVTAETLARIKRDGKQTVKVVHVHEGGQAQVADTINNGTRGGLGSEHDTQSQAKDANASVAALPSPDAQIDGLSLARDEERSLSHARGHEPRSATGK